MAFSYKTRKEEIDRLKSGEKFDLLIIGAGITGAGLAHQAQKLGMKVAIVDKQDFAAGTSSRSTRLVHGGIRYLKTFDVKVVSETVSERDNLQHIAPQLVQPDPMILPIYDEPGTTFDMFSVKVAMDLYDHLAHINETPHLKQYANYTISKDEVLKRVKGLNPNHLVGAGVYLDYQDNDTRFVIEHIKKAHDEGTVAVSRLEAVKIVHNERNQVVGAEVKDVWDGGDGSKFTIHANMVVDCAGPFSDFVRVLDSNEPKEQHVRPTKGVHFVVDGSKLTVKQPIYFGSGTNDGRMIFVIPREGKTYFGTTDTDYHGDFNHPDVTQWDVDYLLNIINSRWPEAHLTVNDIETSWSGLRPLLGSAKPKVDAATGASKAPTADAPSSVSRGSSFTIADDGLAVLSGGKLTDHRLMAMNSLEKIIDYFKEHFNEDFTWNDDIAMEPVSGGDFNPEGDIHEELEKIAKPGTSKGLTADEAYSMASEYGTNAAKIFSYVDEGFKAYEGLSLYESLRLHYGIEEEMVLDPIDYLERRTYWITFHLEQIDTVKDAVVAVIAKELNYSDDQLAAAKKEVQEVIDARGLKDLKAKANA
ncbi:MAG: glycerol-3-phosphate dehydrogenase/oxidase [Lactobacillus sp.]|jgi:alpha-glycerophosphate oxidase|nr:glycerol-3-phosphate dehydrogenase/oxidase [Lactobacillus sp.]MCH3906011.1 glycerol-3-phosphate dehydrogenase/oxidase [Lactobacillus sp.]MCI1943075.1 glycerol-3-phosphate dehydrogenase/oxidase [Lactobacillus sp.]